MENPYQPPGVNPAPARATATTLAAVGAWAASAYWALLTALIGLGVMARNVSSLQLVLPAVLIALYAYRGWQLFQGQTRFARNLLLLHVVGAVVSLLEVAAGGLVVQLIYGTKLAIHVFGAVTSYLASRVDSGGGQSANPFA